MLFVRLKANILTWGGKRSEVTFKVVLFKLRL